MRRSSADNEVAKGAPCNENTMIEFWCSRATELRHRSVVVEKVISAQTLDASKVVVDAEIATARVNRSLSNSLDAHLQLQHSSALEYIYIYIPSS